MRVKGSAGSKNHNSPSGPLNSSRVRGSSSCYSALVLSVCAAGFTWSWMGSPGTLLLSTTSSSTSSLLGGGGGGGTPAGRGRSYDSPSRMTSSSSSPDLPPPVDAAGVATAVETTVAAPYMRITKSLAYEQSFGFFDNVDDFDWKIRMERARDHKHQRSPDHKKATATSDVNQWYLANYYPLFTCPHQERVGFGGDGAKWLCDPWRLKHVLDQPVRHLGLPSSSNGASSSIDNNNSPALRTRRDLPNGSGKCLIYSVGCNGNYVFEDSLVDMLGASTCEIHVFDLSQDYTREGDAANKDIHFHYWGLSSSYSTLGRSKKFNYLTLRQTMEKLGHVGRTIDVFKIDCEHCEWTTFKDWISDDVDVRQLLIETHRLPVKIGVQPSTFFDGIESAGFAMFSKEPNIHPDAGGKSIEWGYVKLRGDFFPPVNVTTA